MAFDIGKKKVVKLEGGGWLEFRRPTVRELNERDVEVRRLTKANQGLSQIWVDQFDKLIEAVGEIEDNGRMLSVEEVIDLMPADIKAAAAIAANGGDIEPGK